MNTELLEIAWEVGLLWARTHPLEAGLIVAGMLVLFGGNAAVLVMMSAMKVSGLKSEQEGYQG